VTPLLRTLCLALTTATIGLVSAAPGVAAPTPPTAQDFGREPAIRGVTISPDGKHIAAVVSPDGVNSYVSIWKTEEVGKAPTNISCGPRTQCTSVGFLKNDRISLQTRQTYTSGSYKGHLFRFFTSDLEGKQFRTADGSLDQTQAPRARVVATLPKDPQNIMIQVVARGKPGEYVPDGSYYKLNLYTGATRKVFPGSDKFFEEQVDLNGEIRARQSLEHSSGDAYIAQWIRDPKTNQWAEHFRWYAKDREPKEVVGFTSDPNIIYVRTNAGRDKAAIFEYDIAAKKFMEPVFEHKLFDAVDVRLSPAAADYGRLLGFYYAGETYKTYWTDPKLASLAKGLRQALGVKTTPLQWTDIATGEKSRYSTPDGADAEIVDWSDDMRFAVVAMEGPRQPAEYYLLTDGGKLTLLGKSRPWFDSATLGDARMIQYPARDGMMVPAFLYTPRKEIYGPGPYPTIVVPHGGPWARDTLDWDSSGWTQYFAARGYAVLQPQYRGSEGWGQKLWRAGDNEWGQKMQDDKDDGVKWLIAQGVAAPDRVAMHGYSYGGYSAMAAAARPNGIYQCVVAGAGPSSMTYMRTRTTWSDFQAEFQGSTIDGLSPIENVSKVNVPVFVYHGDRDDNVPIGQSEKFVSALRSAGKDVQWLELKDMGHSYNTWEPGQTEQVLSAVDTFLKTKCGPGGL